MGRLQNRSTTVLQERELWGDGNGLDLGTGRVGCTRDMTSSCPGPWPSVRPPALCSGPSEGVLLSL